MPCESWPARLALTHPTATASASSCEAPAARSSAAPIFVRRSAPTVGIWRSLAMDVGPLSLAHRSPRVTEPASTFALALRWQGVSWAPADRLGRSNEVAVRAGHKGRAPRAHHLVSFSDFL